MSHSALNAIQQIVKSEDRALAYQFFLFFSRFEYALKRAGFVQANSSGAFGVEPLGSDLRS